MFGKYTADQEAWCRLYEDRTTFPPLMEDYEAGNESFSEAAQKSIKWFEDFSGDALLAISGAALERAEGDDS